MKEFFVKIYLDIDTKYRCDNVILNSFFKREDADEFVKYMTENFKVKAYAISIKTTLLYVEE